MADEKERTDYSERTMYNKHKSLRGGYGGADGTGEGRGSRLNRSCMPSWQQEGCWVCWPLGEMPSEKGNPVYL
jgi:hypothetical protein